MITAESENHKEGKEIEAPDQGVALTRAINAPVKKHMESLKNSMSKIDQIFDQLDKISESLTPQKESVTKKESTETKKESTEKESVVGKLQQMKGRAEGQHKEQLPIQKEKAQEACI